MPVTRNFVSVARRVFCDRVVFSGGASLRFASSNYFRVRDTNENVRVCPPLPKRCRIVANCFNIAVCRVLVKKYFRYFSISQRIKWEINVLNSFNNCSDNYSITPMWGLDWLINWLILFYILTSLFLVALFALNISFSFCNMILLHYVFLIL